MEIIEKLVDFEHCKTCKHCDKKEWEDPCHDCLNESVNTYSRKPVRWEEDKEKKR